MGKIYDFYIAVAWFVTSEIDLFKCHQVKHSLQEVRFQLCKFIIILHYKQAKSKRPIIDRVKHGIHLTLMFGISLLFMEGGVGILRLIHLRKVKQS